MVRIGEVSQPLSELISSQGLGEDDGSGLRDVSDSIDRSLCSSATSTARSSMTLPILDEGSAYEGLLKQMSSPLANLDCALEMVSNELVSYLEIPRPETDTETINRLSLNSFRQTDALPSFASAPGQIIDLKENAYTRRRSLTLADIRPPQREAKGSRGTKRKKISSRGLSAKQEKKVTQSSKFCHICVRSREQVILVPCSNVINSVCRKAVCQKCFEKHGMMDEWESAVRNRSMIKQVHDGALNNLLEDRWICPHCQRMCPLSAQCKIYAKTNRRRHLRLQRRRLERELCAQGKRDVNRNTMSNGKSAVSVLSGASGMPQLTPTASISSQESIGDGSSRTSGTQ
ncbi:unnamed protein product [Agarophyton chilense]